MVTKILAFVNKKTKIFFIFKGIFLLKKKGGGGMTLTHRENMDSLPRTLGASPRVTIKEESRTLT